MGARTTNQNRNMCNCVQSESVGFTECFFLSPCLSMSVCEPWVRALDYLFILFRCLFEDEARLCYLSEDSRMYKYLGWRGQTFEKRSRRRPTYLLMKEGTEMCRTEPASHKILFNKSERKLILSRVGVSTNWWNMLNILVEYIPAAIRTHQPKFKLRWLLGFRFDLQ